MNVTLSREKMREIEAIAIEKAIKKAARAEGLSVTEFKRLYSSRRTYISYYNGLFTIEFNRCAREDKSLLAKPAKGGDLSGYSTLRLPTVP